MSLFGGNQQNTQPSGGSSLFGPSTNQGTNTGGSSLFGGSNTNTNTGNTGGSLFPSSTNQQPATGGSSLFGPSTNQQNTGSGGGGGLFGASTNQSNTGGGLFPSSTNQQNNTGGGGLFGASTNQQPSGGGGLFGASTVQNTQNNTGGGLFGSNNNAGTGGLLGGNTTQQNANPQGQSSLVGGGSSLFGGNTQQQQPSMFAGSNQNQQPQQAQQQGLSTSVFNPPTVSVGNFGHTMSSAQLQRLQLGGASTIPNEKTVAEQIRTIALKWNPDNDANTPPTTILKTYLYNSVPKEYAPFFYPNTAAGEDEKSWEEALSQKPEPPKVDGKEVTTQAYVPILVKGFKALGERAEMQAHIVQQMQSRLHEMNNSLTAVMNAHQQRITVNIAKAKRQHEVLKQRCLRLAVKVQVLRNRGYALDASEEGLRKTLMSLEKQVMDPGFMGREDEIWARMIQLKEKARWLEEEGKRVSAAVDEQRQRGEGPASAVPEDVLAKTRKILKDYDGQLQHLNKEMEDVKKEFAEWEESQSRRR